MRSSVVKAKVSRRKTTFGPRERVLDAALRLFTQKGYFNTSIPDIVQESGVSTGSIYHYFRDKEGIAKALFDGLKKRIEQAFADIERRHKATEDQCKAVIEYLFHITEEEPCAMEFMLYAKHKEFLPEKAPVCSSKPFRLMRQMVANGMIKGEVRPMDADIAAAAVYGPAIRLIQHRLDGLIDKPLMNYLDDVWACTWRSVKT
jgi:AcrR family transcriptional regulator